MKERSQERLIFAAHTRKYPNLPLALDGLGICHLQEPIDRPFGMNFWQWIQCVEGSGILMADGRAYTVAEGCGMLIPQGTPSLYYDSGKPWYVNFLCCGGALFSEITSQLGLQTAGVYYLLNPDKILAFWNEIAETYDQNTLDAHLSLSALLYQFLITLSQEIHLSHSGRPQSQPQHEKIHAAVCFMQEHYSEDIGLDEIADAAGLSKEYLCQIFKKYTGSTLLEHLTETRISEAKVLLLSNPQKTVGEIARLCGFGSPSYFCSVFKKSEHMTPLQFAQGR